MRGEALSCRYSDAIARLSALGRELSAGGSWISALGPRLSALRTEACEIFSSACDPMAIEDFRSVGTKRSEKNVLFTPSSFILRLSPLSAEGPGVLDAERLGSGRSLKPLFSYLFVPFFVLLWLFLFVSSGVLEAADASLEIRIPDHAVTVGDRVSVRVQAQGGDDGLWGDLALSPGFEKSWAVAEGPREIPRATPPAWEIILVPLALGDLELPKIEASLRDADGQVVNIAPSETSTITVASVLAPEDEGQPSPLRDPVGIVGFPWEWVAPLLSILLPLLVLAAWWWRRRSGVNVDAGVPRLAPIDELERLLGEVQDEIGRNPAEVVCDRLAFGIRRYLERRTGEPAAEMTSHELQILARQAGWPKNVQPGLLRLTGVADGVRFGRRSVADSDLVATAQVAGDIGRELEIHLTPVVAGDEGGD